MHTDDEEEVFVCSLTTEEYEALGEGEVIAFDFDGDVIERDPTIAIEVAERE